MFVISIIHRLFEPFERKKSIKSVSRFGGKDNKLIYYNKKNETKT